MESHYVRPFSSYQFGDEIYDGAIIRSLSLQKLRELNEKRWLLCSPRFSVSAVWYCTSSECTSYGHGLERYVKLRLEYLEKEEAKKTKVIKSARKKRERNDDDEE